jgi:hypothetical protein
MSGLCTAQRPVRVVNGRLSEQLLALGVRASIVAQNAIRLARRPGDQRIRTPSLDHFVRAQHEGLRDCDAKRLSGFEVKDEFELGWLLDR